MYYLHLTCLYNCLTALLEELKNQLAGSSINISDCGTCKKEQHGGYLHGFLVLQSSEEDAFEALFEQLEGDPAVIDYTVYLCAISEEMHPFALPYA